jgi:response regulator RpfG family c-di-GMP phosphodiesterase
MQGVQKRPTTSLTGERIIRLINSSLDIDVVLNLSMRLMEKTLDATASSILLYDQETNELKFYLVTGSKKDVMRIMRMPADQGVAGRCFQTGKTLLIPDASKSKFFYKQMDEKTKFKTQNLIATPIPIKGRRIGVIEVLNKAHGTFTPSDANRLKHMTEEVAVAIHNARLYDEVKSAYTESMLSMARAEKFRDADTGQHIERCGEYALRLGPALGFKEKELAHLRISMMMHDIGKVAIPDAILLKPSRLTAEEIAVMRTHTTKGGEILGRTAHLQRAIEIALCHHEQWDGAGYPQGLKGNAIPLSGRLASVIDVFDALMSKRPYKEPFTPQQVQSILKEKRGSAFDPAVLDVFLERFDEMVAVHLSLL